METVYLRRPDLRSTSRGKFKATVGIIQIDENSQAYIPTTSFWFNREGLAKTFHKELQALGKDADTSTDLIDLSDSSLPEIRITTVNTAPQSLIRLHAQPTLYCSFVTEPVKRFYRAPIDTGAECNIVSYGIAKQLNLPIQASPVTSTSYYRTEVRIEGYVVTDLLIGGYSIRQIFYVMPNGYKVNPVLLGMPFVVSTKFLLEYSD